MGIKKKMVLRCIGIDDEFSCNKILAEYCKDIIAIDMVATFTDPVSAIPLLQAGEIDLVFLDFNMGSIQAPYFIQYIPEQCQVIIVSGELKSVIIAYGMRVIDILFKPYSKKQLLVSVEKALQLAANPRY